jgi:hypothetical protein
MAHDDTFQPDPDRTDSSPPQAGTLRSEDDRHERVEGPDLVDRAQQHGSTASPQGTAGVVLGSAGLPDRESMQESNDPASGDTGAALERPTGLGATRGDEQSFEKTPGQISGVGGTRATGAGTGRPEGSASPTP